MDVKVRLNALYTLIHMGMSCQFQAPAVLLGNLYVTVLVGFTTPMIEQKASNLYFSGLVNLLTPNVNYSGRTAPLTSKFAFYIFVQQI